MGWWKCPVSDDSDDDGFTNAHTYQNSSDLHFKWIQLLYINYISVKLLFKVHINLELWKFLSKHDYEEKINFDSIAIYIISILKIIFQELDLKVHWKYWKINPFSIHHCDQDITSLIYKSVLFYLQLFLYLKII